MFVAWRDLRFARGRFALVGTVVALVTLLVVLLSGLTAGLARDSTSAIVDLRADHLVFSAPAGGERVSFTTSAIDRDVLGRWRQVPGVRRADPLGIATTKAEAGAHSAALAAFGVAPGAPTAPDGRQIATGEAVLSTGAADALRARPGATVALGGRPLTVTAVAGDASYRHTPVAWISLPDWRHVSPGPAAATVIALTTSAGADLAAADRQLGTRTVPRAEASSAIDSYAAEHTSLQLMRGLLLAISALVIAAFFTVWTIQRSSDVAVLKALGARTSSLLRDALAQAVVVLTAGAAAGAGLAALAGSIAAGSVPFVVSAGTMLVPALTTVALGALGAALAIRRITSVDPLTALGRAP